MSTNRRQRKRQLKMSMRYVDHVMGNMSQKQKDVDKAVKLKETRVEKGDLNEVIRENEISNDGGVFGYKPNKGEPNEKPNDESNEELIIGSQNVYGITDRQENEELNKKPNKHENEKWGNGNEVDVFDEVLVAEGSKRWEMTVYGYFVGYR
ncbi:hypothetical protein Tco_1550812 [Tanacetum coccineum]